MSEPLPPPVGEPASPLTDHKGNPLNDAIEIVPLGQPGAGGAHLLYRLRAGNALHIDVAFQNGDPANGINGLTMEALLAIVLHRLRGFQSGPFPHVVNLVCAELVGLVLNLLKTRSRERIARGVEGKTTP